MFEISLVIDSFSKCFQCILIFESYKQLVVDVSHSPVFKAMCHCGHGQSKCVLQLEAN